VANGARLTQNHAFPERAPNILPRRLEIHLTGTHHGRTVYANKMFSACWFCKLGIEDSIPDNSVFSRARHER